MFDFTPQLKDGLDSRFFGCEIWVPYQIPRKARMLSFVVLAGGGVGGNGHTRAAGGAGGGGGGGGGGAAGVGMIPCALLPEVIYVRVGRGGVAGLAGGSSTIAVLPENTAAYNIITAGAGGAGGNGTISTVGVAGAAGASPSVSTNSYLTRFAVNSNTTGGQAGAAGGAVAGAAGGAITVGSVVFGFGGTGGAGCTTTDFAGGAFTGDKTRPSGAGGVAAGGNGVPGYTRRHTGLFVATSGTGGGSNNSGVAGSGGSGGLGCGGGGGGAGATGGTGGRGGDGFILITPIY